MIVNNWPLTLREFRATHGLSQARLASALSTSTRTIERWEAGDRSPPDFLRMALERLAQTMGAYIPD